MARMGLYPDAPKVPFVPGYEIAGDVEAVGEGVTGFEVGDRVAGGCRFGGYSELVAARPSELVALPEGWSYSQGAALPVVYATAYAGLVAFGNLQRGDRVLVHAAAGGVGIAATQIAKLLGAEVFGTASPEKHEAIRSFGVDHAIDYRSKDFVEEVRRIAGEEEPLDLVLDGIGGRSWKQSYSLLHPGGRLVCFGASAVVGGEKRNVVKAAATLARTPRFNPLKLASESKSVIGLNMLRLLDTKESLEEYVEPLVQWAEQGLIEPIVDAEFPLERAADAHRRLQDRKNVGKVVLTL
jgi:NADPH:quinone reductase-like Zn-dependent oxidoreductase